MGLSTCCLQLSKAEVIQKMELTSSEGTIGKGDVVTVRRNSD